jgi:hypothetical protein
MAQNQQLGTFGQVVSVNTAANTVTITSQIAVGNVSINSTGISISGGSVNNTNYPGTANNANNLGGVAAASYVNTAGSYTITGVHTHDANIIIGTSAGLSANGGFGSSGQSLLSNGSSVYWATAGATLNANNTDGTTYYIGLSSGTSGSWTNAVVATSGLSFVPSTGTLTVGNTIVGATFTGTANVATYLGNSSATVANVSSWITTNAASAYSNAVTYTDTSIGTANAAITGNAATAYTNAVSYTDTKIGTANAAITGNAATAYTNAVSYVDGLKLDSVTNTSISLIPVANTVKNAYDRAIDANTRAASAQTAAAAAYTNAVSYVDGKILTANAAITGNAATAYTNATTFAANATNISSGTLAEARLPYRMDQNVRSTDSITVGNITVSGNLYVGSNVNIIGSNVVSYVDAMIYLNANNTIANPDIGFAGNYNDGTYQHTGFFRDASDGIWKVFDSYLPEPDANTYIDTTNTSFHLANFQANNFIAGNTSSVWFRANTSGVYVNSTLIGNATGPYGKTEASLSVATANNSTYAYGKTEGNLNVNNATTAYGKTEGNLNVNNATTAYGKTEGNLNVNSALTSNNSSYLGGTAAASYVTTSSIGGLTANNASYLGGVAAASYLTTSSASSTYAPLASPTFTGTVSVAQANVLNQTLTDGATISWNTASGQVATVTIGASRTMGAPSNLKVGTYILHVIQGGSGSYGITWNSVFKWPAGVAPVLSTAVGARDVFSFISDGTNLYGSYLTDVK